MAQDLIPTSVVSITLIGAYTLEWLMGLLAQIASKESTVLLMSMQFCFSCIPSLLNLVITSINQDNQNHTNF